jgi:uncharacterized protein
VTQVGFGAGDVPAAPLGATDMRTWLTQNRNIMLISAALLTGGLVTGGYLLGDGLRRAHLADRAVTLRGLAERDVVADLASWTITFTETGTELEPTRQGAEADAATVTNFLRQAGFPADQVSDSGISVNQMYDSDRGANVVTVRRRIQLRTRDVPRAQQAFARQAELIRAGVAIEEGSNISYHFTRLNDIKPEMIAAATQDARRGAEQFARDSGTEVGGIRSATQGYFSITGREGEDEGSGRDSPLQKVRVVTTIEFYLR